MGLNYLQSPSPGNNPEICSRISFRTMNVDAYNALPDHVKEVHEQLLNEDYLGKVVDIYEGVYNTNWPNFADREGCIETYPTNEEWLYPILRLQQEKLWPTLLKQLDDTGHDGKAVLEYCIKLAQKYGYNMPDDVLAALGM